MTAQVETTRREVIATREDGVEELIADAAQALQEEAWCKMQVEKAGRMVEEWKQKGEDFWKKANAAFDRYSDLVCQIRMKGG